MRLRVAVIGAGVGGNPKPGVEVQVFDQGRRGPGGRASHRMVDRASGSVLQDEEGEAMESALRFDHGCQFFTAASPRFQGIVEKWVADGAVREWKGNVGVVPGPARGAAGDFFGSSTGLPLFVGVGGMHRVAHRLAERAVSA
eukprot:CAMPEP_0177761326 /NCGR_PEP_ID=MMETSP0491_2-20121128/5745_1 /TAXON_ID=63592 /ORGANISM="Tetraselmis chuii, Strain PLY429" /LENGTH=141 /DNA_ID=CAMNT_0019277293 /DNA_START=110 /DNA_END=532 /DNA_ORIENTATION=+